MDRLEAFIAYGAGRLAPGATVRISTNYMMMFHLKSDIALVTHTTLIPLGDENRIYMVIESTRETDNEVHYVLITSSVIEEIISEGDDRMIKTDKGCDVILIRKGRFTAVSHQSYGSRKRVGIDIASDGVQNGIAVFSEEDIQDLTAILNDAPQALLDKGFVKPKEDE